MRFYEDLNYYYFSTNPETDEEERSIIIESQTQYAKEYLHEALKPEPTLVGNIVKFSAIGVFVLAVALLIIFSLNKMVAPIFFTFGGLFILFGIAVAIPGKKEEQIELPQQAKMPKGLGFALLMGIGFTIIAPAIIAPKFGYSKAAIAACGTMFLFAGLFFIAYTIVGMVRYSRAMKETVQGRCIGYIKMLDSGDSDGNTYSRRLIVGTPVYEYHYNGNDYKAFQEDDLKSGRLKPDVGEVVELGVLPGEPYSVFCHKNTGGKVIAIVISLIALAAGIFLFAMVPSASDNNGFAVNTAGGQVILSRAKFDDKLIESYISTSEYTIEYVTVTSVYEINGRWAIDISNGQTRMIAADEADKFHEGTCVYIVTPANGTPGLNFIADYWEYSGDREVIGLPG